MTNEELSQRIAELYEIKTHTYMNGELLFWLHDDSARVFELMCQYNVEIEVSVGLVGAYNWTGQNLTTAKEYHTKHNNDKALATRVAILKCLLKMKE